MAEQQLRFGKLSALYENGFMRYVCAGDQEVIRLIYLAMRNHNWVTAPMRITDEVIEADDQNFTIRYNGINVEGVKEIFRWQVKITGKASGEIMYRVKGEALDTFRRNRAGICVLHPIGSTSGKPAIVTHPDGRQTLAKFPTAISPHQPFLEIRSLKWQVNEEVGAQLDFEGDIFEMEDQRNWTDASFKTYSTPLSIPIPVTLHPGDTVFQKVTLKITGLENVKAPPSSAGSIEISIDKSARVAFPKIGTGHAAGQPLPDKDAIVKLKRLRLDHLRVELSFANSLWAEVVNQGITEAALLELPLEFALVFDESPTKEWLAFLDHLKGMPPSRVMRISLFGTRQKVSLDALLPLLLLQARIAFPKAQAGSGSVQHFVDLNRYPFQFDQVDFISFSLSPQVHASDSRTMVENVEAQRDAVLYAKELTKNKPVVVSPVTLRPRAVFSTSARKDQLLSPDVDPRQASHFAAAWTLASLKHIAESGASAVTFYESHGMKGFLIAAKDDCHPDFGTSKEVFPVYDLMESIRKFKPTHTLSSSTTDSLRLSSLVLLRDTEVLIVVANHTNETLEFRLEDEHHRVEGHGIMYFSLPPFSE